MVKKVRNIHSNNGTQLEKSLAAVDRAIEKLGKEGIQKIIDSIPDMPGPLLRSILRWLNNIIIEKWD